MFDSRPSRATPQGFAPEAFERMIGRQVDRGVEQACRIRRALARPPASFGRGRIVFFARIASATGSQANGRHGLRSRAFQHLHAMNRGICLRLFHNMR